MKATMIKKLNTILSLWLLAILTTLIIFGYELSLFGFYIAAVVVMGVLLTLNVFTLITGFIYSNKKSLERETEYR